MAQPPPPGTNTYQSDQTYDPSSWMSAAGNYLANAGDTAKNAAGQAWNAIKPPSTAGIDQAAADARALQNQFIQQMGNQQSTPGLQYGGSAPVVQATSSDPNAGGGFLQSPGVSPANQAPPLGMATPGSNTAVPGQPGSSPAPTTYTPPPMGGSSIPGTAAPPPMPVTGPGAEARSGAGHFQDYSATGPSVPGSTTNGPAPPGAPPNADAMNGSVITGGAAPNAPGMVATAMQAAQMQGGPQFNAAQLDPSQQQQFRQGQMGLAGSLQDTIAGRTTSVAQLQQQQAFAQQQAQQMGLAAAMGRGGNTALAMRTAANNMGGLGAQQAAASALQRAQETAMAQNQLGAVLNAGRGADIGLAGQNAQLSQQGGMLNNQNAWNQNQVNAGYIQQGNMANQQAQQQANANNQQAQMGFRQQNIAEQGQRANEALQANQNQGQAAGAQFAAGTSRAQQYGGLASAGLGALATLSDRRAKKDIGKADSSQFRDFLSKLQPSNFKYKGGDEDETGVMAQDVQKSRVGSGLVRDTRIGKVIDVPRTTTALLASLADMHKRVSKLEGSKGRKRAA